MTRQTLIFILLFIFMFNFQSFSQTIEKSQVSSISFDPSGKIYNKYTGAKISDKEFGAYIKDNPRVSFDYEINKFGQVIKYLLDSTSRSSSMMLTTHEMEIGATFPEFVFKSIDGKKIKSADQLGNWIVLRFENYLSFDSLSTIRFDQNINNYQNSEEIIFISCFQEGKTELTKLGDQITNINFVPEAHYFYLKYKVALSPDKLPTIIVIDPNGIVDGYYYPEQDLDLKFLLDQ